MKRFVGCYLTVFFLATVLSGIRFLHLQTAWTMGEWLINYEGGFVRRGLIGEVGLWIAHLLHIRPILSVMLVGVCIYALLFWSVYQLTRSLHWNIWTVLLFISPASIAFGTVSVRSYQKEIVLFAGLAALLVWLKQGNYTDTGLAVWLSVFCAVGVLNHEPFVVFTPYVVAGMALFIRDWKRLARLTVLPFLVLAGCTYAVTKHHGTAQTAQAICSSLGTSEEPLCNGAIGSLAGTSADAREDVKRTAVEDHYYTMYPPRIVLGLLPVIGWIYLRRRKRNTIIIAGFGALSCALSVVLFMYAVDWGRWIQIHLFCLFLLIMASEQKETEPDVHWNPVLAVSAVAYALCWSIPGFATTPMYGYLSMLGRFTHRFTPN